MWLITRVGSVFLISETRPQIGDLLGLPTTWDSCSSVDDFLEDSDMFADDAWMIFGRL
jgi:hypothetical protein